MPENVSQDLSGVLESLLLTLNLHPIESMARTFRFYHFQLGKTGGI